MGKISRLFVNPSKSKPSFWTTVFYLKLDFKCDSCNEIEINYMNLTGFTVIILLVGMFLGSII